MFGLSFPELITILVVALLVLGPERLPRAASEMGRWLGRLRRQSDELRREFYRTVYLPVKEDTEQMNRSLKTVRDDIQAVTNEVKDEVVHSAPPSPPDSSKGTE